jgi:chromosome partitioning protein
MVFIINGATSRAKLTGEATITIYQRKDFTASMFDGRTIQEIDPKTSLATKSRNKKLCN